MLLLLRGYNLGLSLDKLFKEKKNKFSENSQQQLNIILFPDGKT